MREIAENIIGKKFGRLTILKTTDRRTNARKRYVLCICDCGIEKEIVLSPILSGKIRSCGCLSKERTRAMATTHGFSNTKKKQHSVWRAIKQRCLNPNNKDYEYYGGRGISLCDRWMRFENFLEDMGERPEGYTIERINNDGNYCPENCKWASRKEQSENTKKNVFIEWKGKRQVISKWASETGINRQIISKKFKAGLPIELVFSKGGSLDKNKTQLPQSPSQTSF